MISFWCAQFDAISGDFITCCIIGGMSFFTGRTCFSSNSFFSSFITRTDFVFDEVHFGITFVEHKKSFQFGTLLKNHQMLPHKVKSHGELLIRTPGTGTWISVHITDSIWHELLILPHPLQIHRIPELVWDLLSGIIIEQSRHGTVPLQPHFRPLSRITWIVLQFPGKGQSIYLAVVLHSMHPVNFFRLRTLCQRLHSPKLSSTISRFQIRGNFHTLTWHRSVSPRPTPEAQGY